MFLISDANVLQLFYSTKLFLLKNVKWSIFLSKQYNTVQEAVILFARVLISLRLNPDNDPDHYVWIRIKSLIICAGFLHTSLCIISVRLICCIRLQHLVLVTASAVDIKWKRPTILKEDRSFLNKIMERNLSVFEFFQSCFGKIYIIDVVIKHHPTISTDTVLCFVKIEAF